VSIPEAQETTIGDPTDHEGRVLDSLASVVDDYIQRYGMKKAQELAFYANLANVDEVVEVAARFQAPNGKCQPRQCGIPRESKDEVAELLDTAALGSPSSFGELEEALRRCIGHVKGIGDMTIYDTALRVGAFLGLLPSEIYLHGAARDGAAMLGLDVGNRTVPVTVMPREFSVLEPWELEDCLALYRDDLARIQAGPAAA